MQRLNKIVSTLLALAVLGAVGAGAYYGVRLVIELFRGLDKEIANIIYTALVVGFFSMVLISLVSRRVQARAKRKQLLTQKVEAYRRFIAAWSETPGRELARDPYHERLPMHQIEDAEKALLLLASDTVIKRYAEFQSLDDGSEDKVKVLDGLLREMRRDLGHRNGGFKAGELAALLLQGSPDSARSGRTAPLREQEEGQPAY